MDDDLEKRIKLDELPDAGSEPQPQAKPNKRPPKETPDPRLERLKTMDDKSKVETMIQKWYFDQPEWSFAWVPVLVILLGVEFSNSYQVYLNELDMMNKNTMEFAGGLIQAFTVYLEAFIRHPIILAILIPIFFRFKKASEYFLEITFDGIKTVKSVVPMGSKDMVLRTSVKWKDISKVDKGMVDKKEVLRLYSLDGKMAEIIWTFPVEKKRAIKLLLSGLINNKHPMREFLDNEKELK